MTGRTRIAAAVALLAGAALQLAPLAPLASAQDAAALAARFERPPPACRPLVRWWWPGGFVEEPEIRRELARIAAAGFGGVEIQPLDASLAGLAAGDRALVDDVFSPRFMALVRAAVDEAARLGLRVELTFGSGWPFGGGDAIPPERAACELRGGMRLVKGPVHFAEPLAWPAAVPGLGDALDAYRGVALSDDWRARLAARERLVAVVAARGTGPTFRPAVSGFDPAVASPGVLEADSLTVLTGKVRDDGVLAWDVPEGLWRIFTFVMAPADVRVVAGAGHGPQLVLDHFDRAAFDAHAARIGGAFDAALADAYGRTVTGVFCDSLELHAWLHWTPDFLAEFETRRGYDLTPYLPLLKQDGYGVSLTGHAGEPHFDAPGVGEAVRHDYWRTVSDLLVESVYEPFAAWAKQRGLLARIQAHRAPVDVLRAYGVAHVPEAEDLFAGGRRTFLRMATSAARVYGAASVSCESFVELGRAYAATPGDLDVRAHRLLAAGIDQIVAHGFAYDVPGWPAPGWYPFRTQPWFSTYLSHRNPLFRFLRPVNDAIARVQTVLRDTQAVARAAVLRAEPQFPNEWQAPPVCAALDARGLEFDFVNGHALGLSQAGAGTLRAPSGAEYRVLVVPDAPALPVEVVGALHDLARRGVPVVFAGGLPRLESGWFRRGLRSERVRVLVERMIDPPRFAGAPPPRPAVQAPTVDAALGAIEGIVPANVRIAAPDGATFAEVEVLERGAGATRIFLVHDAAGTARDLALEFRVGRRMRAESWNPRDGSRTPLAAQPVGDRGFVRVRLPLGAHETSIVVFTPAPAGEEGAAGDARVAAPEVAVAPDLAEPPAPIAVGDGGWTLRLAAWPFAPVPPGNGDADVNAAATGARLSELGDWSVDPALAAFCGTGRYETEVLVPPAWLRQDRQGGALRIDLDLGRVGDVAEVVVNGAVAGTTLRAPHRLDVTERLRPGKNRVTIAVTNSLFDAMRARGEAFPGDPPAPAGLMGPVRLVPRVAPLPAPRSDR